MVATKTGDGSVVLRWNSACFCVIDNYVVWTVTGVIIWWWRDKQQAGNWGDGYFVNMDQIYGEIDIL